MSCPTCKKETVQEYRPFCSQHCADIDLGRWFNGTYTVPAEEAEDMEEAAAALEKQPHDLH